MMTKPASTPLKESAKHRWAIVLAGGEGKRLQSFLKTELGLEHPKQFCAIVGKRSMLRHTLDRISSHIEPTQTLTSVSSQHYLYALQQLNDGSRHTLISQPRNCETGPGILLPLLHILRSDLEASIAIFPSDHFILEENLFMDHVRAAFSFVSKNPDLLVTLGVEPREPYSGYGWIDRGDLLGKEGKMSFYRMKNLWEKPSKEATHSLYTNGCLINTFVLCGTAATFVRLLKESMPEIFTPFQRVWAALGTPRQYEITREVFRTLPSVNFSYAIQQFAPRYLGVLPMKGVHWSDWGNEERIRSDINLLARRNGRTHIERRSGQPRVAPELLATREFGVPSKLNGPLSPSVSGLANGSLTVESYSRIDHS